MSSEAAEERSPAADRVDAALWMLLGAAVLWGAWTMDRLENQDVPAFAAPGLLPGLLGVALLAMGGLLLARSLGRSPNPAAAPPLLGPAPGRALGVIALCVVFGVGLVGHGLPFWAAAAIFVTIAIPFLRGRFNARQWATAAAIGLGAGFAITLVFQQLFLVRLP